MGKKSWSSCSTAWPQHGGATAALHCWEDVQWFQASQSSSPPTDVTKPEHSFRLSVQPVSAVVSLGGFLPPVSSLPVKCLVYNVSMWWLSGTPVKPSTPSASTISLLFQECVLVIVFDLLSSLYLYIDSDSGGVKCFCWLAEFLCSSLLKPRPLLWQRFLSGLWG